MAVDHKNVADLVITALKALTLRGYSASDVHQADFPFHKEPPFGLVVSPLEEQAGSSTNETTDIGYPCLITRVGVRLNSHDGFESRDDWRRDVWRRFNRVRLGLECELITGAEFHTIEIKSAWESWNIDASALVVTTWIREVNNTV